mgnify:FL=1
MKRIMLKGKIHRATITDTSVDYEGSITIDSLLLEAANILPYEQVHVVDINNGSRFETYTIKGEPGSGKICVNGAAARLVSKGDKVIILAYAVVEDEKAYDWHPDIVLVDSKNRIKLTETSSGRVDFGDLAAEKSLKS